MKPSEQVLGLPEHLFRDVFRLLCAKFRLSPELYKPYSLRRGGATAFYTKTDNYQRTQTIGRWNSPNTCRIYVQEALAAAAKIRQSAFDRAFSEKYANMVHEILQ